MNFIDKLGATLSDSVDFLVNKNRQCAQLNRLDAIIRNETEMINSAYVALGKIYLKKLEGESVDTDTKLIIDSINISKLRLKKAVARYEYIQKFGVPDTRIGTEYNTVGAEQYAENADKAKAADDTDEGDITIAYSGDTAKKAEPKEEKESVESIVIEEAKAEEPQTAEAVQEEPKPVAKKSTAEDLKKKRSRKKPIVKSTDAEAASESDTVL